MRKHTVVLLKYITLTLTMTEWLVIVRPEIRLGRTWYGDQGQNAA